MIFSAPIIAPWSSKSIWIEMKRTDFLRFCFRPQSAVLLLLLLLFSLFGSYLFTRPEKKSTPSPEEAFRQMEDALLEANRSVARARTEEEKLPFRASVIFYKMAMEHSFPVWESDFYSEVLHRFSALAVSFEKSEEEKAEAARLESILFQEDRAGFVSYLEEKMREMPLTNAEIAIQTEQNKLLFLSDSPSSGGREELLGDIRLLRESLSQGENRFHLAGKSAPLLKSERARLQALLEIKILQFRSGQYSAAPANDQTLRSSEAFLALGLALSLIALFFQKEKEEASLPLRKKMAFRAVLFFVFFIPTASVFIFTAVLFAPDAAQPAFFLIANSFFKIPFALAAFLRLFLRTVSFLPFVFWMDLGKDRAFSSKASALGCVLWYLCGILAPLFGGIGIRIGHLFSFADAIFPSLSRYSLLPANRLWGILLFAILFSIPIWLQKNKKRT